jgi:acyl transferase domain-containing protein
MHQTDTESHIAETDIAIIGTSCRFPGADDPEEFWENLREGIESVTFFSDEVLLANGVSPELLKNPKYVKANPVLKNPQQFDAEFFGIPPLQAEVMDPQQRLFLECAWEALESAGIVPEQNQGTVGVFAGAGISSYLHRILPNNGNFFESAANFQLMLGNDKDYLPMQVSYKLNLTGPSVNVQTACSTSLVALHLACQGILNGECDIALAGGVSVFHPHNVGYLFQEGMIFSPDGHCRPFDRNAKGTTFGSGAGVVVLKLLSQALEEGDPIRAVIKGTAINNDGSRKVGFTAPSVSGQAAVIAEAMGIAGVSPESISYVETHGTATELGDPIEIRALTQAFQTETDNKGYCAIGSVKSNMGHLISAAGVAGTIKTVLALENKQIPPSLNFESPNPTIEFEESPFFVNTKLKDWTTDGSPRLAGVSAFGIGGTNAHAVLAEAPNNSEGIRPSSRPRVLLTLSGESEGAAVDLAAKYARFFKKNPDVSLADAAYTTHVGRKHFKVRAAYTAADTAEMIRELELSPSVEQASCLFPSNESNKLAFLFTGQGSQLAGMGEKLYETEPIFREILNRCDEAFRGHRDRSLREIIFAEASSDGNDLINQTEFSQPCLYAIECGIAALFATWGIKPASVLGHSIGEFAAAWMAGVFELEEGLLLVAERGRLMQELPRVGGMVNVFASQEAIATYLDDGCGVCLAAVNAPDAVVISGEKAALDKILQQLKADKIPYKPLVVSHAFHSHLMEPMLEKFEGFASQFDFRLPEIPFVSSATGTVCDRPLDAAYWTQQIRSAVRFNDGLRALVNSGFNVFLEIGPKPILSGLGKKTFPSLTWIPSLTRNPVFSKNRVSEDVKNPVSEEDLLDALGTIYACGLPIDWEAFHADERRLKIPLPTYAFQRKTYWPEKTMIQTTSTTSNEKETRFFEKTGFLKEERSPAAAKIKREMTQAIAKMMRVDEEQLDLEKSFLALGLDSLTLLNIIAEIEKKYGITLGVHQFFDELTDLQQLIDYLIEEMPIEEMPEEPEPEPVLEPVQANGSMKAAIPTAPPVAAIAPQSPPQSGNASGMERIVEQQLSLMAKQLELLQGKTNNSVNSPMPTVAATPQETQQQTVEKTEKTVEKSTTPAPFSFWGAKGNAGKPPTAEQQAFIDKLIREYAERSKSSKANAAAYRDYLADRRSIRGLRPELKEIFYPIVADRARGSRIWDLDGNEYVDITMGFGVHLFGHNPDFIMEPVKEVMEKGVQVGPQSPLAGEVAKLFAEVTGKERVTFCNSGTEAVMTALRIARAASGKSKIVKFKGAYHGHFDGTLAIPAETDGAAYGQPMFPGTSPKMVEDVIVLDYGKPESLETIRRNKHELAAVIVEPVQSRLLSLAPKEFLQELRAFTREENIILIFDEVILGFRAASGGSQEYFGVEADIATYGKAVGGGMPIGVVAGKAKYLDYIDGGTWKYGDQSYPQTEPTYFAGTFCKHPLAMAAAKAVLLHLKDGGGALQTKLNDATASLALELNTYFQTEGLMLRVDCFSSIFRIEFQSPFGELYLPIEMDLLFYLLIFKGVYVWEGRVCFLSAAHTQEDVNRIVAVVKESVEELRSVGYFSGGKSGGKNSAGKSGGKNSGGNSGGKNSSAKKKLSYPLTEEQQRLLEIARDERGSTAYNESISFELQGTLDVDRLRYAVNTVVNRHHALRTYMAADGSKQIVASEVKLEVPLLDLSGGNPDEALQQWLFAESQKAFDLYQGPPMRVSVVKLGSDVASATLRERHVLNVCTHHIISDGWSLVVVLAEICKLYTGSSELPPVQQFVDYLKWYDRESQSEGFKASERFWLERIDEAPPLKLPFDCPPPERRTYNGARVSVRVEPELVRALKERSMGWNATLFHTLLSAYAQQMKRFCQQDVVTVGISVGGRPTHLAEHLVGYCSHFIPIVLDFKETGACGDSVQKTKTALGAALKHQNVPFARLLGRLPRSRREEVIQVTFNLDIDMTLPNLTGLQSRIISQPVSSARYAIGLNVIPESDCLHLDLDYNTDLFKAETMKQFLKDFMELLEGAGGNI